MKAIRLLALFLAAALTAVAETPGRTNFEITIRGLAVNLERFSCFVLPGDTVNIFVSDNPGGTFSIYSATGTIIEKAENSWSFIPPKETGQYEVLIRNSLSASEISLIVFVMVPATQIRNGYLNGYRIGDYPAERYKNRKNYQNPSGFIEVTAGNQEIFLAPHFSLKQFLCKQHGNWPKYVVINPKLIKKLELILEKLNREGISAKTLFVMSGYRTPYYNKAIKNVKYSRHVFGDASDIYVDENHDAVMDDLNGDGLHNMKDALVLKKIINRIDNDPGHKDLLGGMGVYNKNAVHTFFVHTDTRGYKARW